GFGTAVELSGDDAGNSGRRGYRAGTRQTAPQLLIPFVAVAEVTHYSRKTLQFSVFVFERHGNGIGPETRPVLFQMPAFTGEMAFAEGPLELFFRRSPKRLIGGIKKRCVLMTGFAGIIAVDAFRALIPGNDPRVG